MVSVSGLVDACTVHYMIRVKLEAISENVFHLSLYCGVNSSRLRVQ